MANNDVSEITPPTHFGDFCTPFVFVLHLFLELCHKGTPVDHNKYSFIHLV